MKYRTDGTVIYADGEQQAIANVQLLTAGTDTREELARRIAAALNMTSDMSAAELERWGALRLIDLGTLEKLERRAFEAGWDRALDARTISGEGFDRETEAGIAFNEFKKVGA
jgi:hypothetical protein